jgi:hypothetical protein
MRLLTPTIFILSIVASGCSGAASPIPPPIPSEEPTPVENTDDGETTTIAEGMMTDVPGDDAADMVPNCEDKEVCSNMGVFAAMSGKGNVAVALLKKACDLGSGSGCSRLANLYSAGKAIPIDHAKAVIYFEKAREYFDNACEKGDTDACDHRDKLDARAAHDKKSSDK